MPYKCAPICDTENVPKNGPKVEEKKTFEEDYKILFKDDQVPKKNKLTKLPNPKKPLIELEVIELSGYSKSGISDSLFRDFSENIIKIKSLKRLALSDNGLDNRHLSALVQIAKLKQLTALDISANKLDKDSAVGLSKVWKETVTSLGYLKYSNQSVQKSLELFIICHKTSSSRN